MHDSHNQLPGIAPVLRGNSVPEEGEAIRVPIPNWGDDEVAGVKVNKENEVVRSIEITCRCGHTIEIVCEYEDPSGAAEQS